MKIHYLTFYENVHDYVLLDHDETLYVKNNFLHNSYFYERPVLRHALQQQHVALIASQYA